MDSQIELQKIIGVEMNRIRSLNPNFSLRALARRFSIQPSAMSEILSGKRIITKRMAQKILERLSVDPEKTSKILNHLSNRLPKKSNGRQEYLQVNMDHYHVISDWYYFAILSLAETSGFRSEPEWIAKRLNIKPREAATALKRLTRLELLGTGKQFATSTDVANLYLRKSHYQNLELARLSLDNDPVDLRDFTAMTMAVDPTKVKKAKEMIKDFRRKLSQFMEGGKKTEVFKVCIQLFPLTKGQLK